MEDIEARESARQSAIRRVGTTDDETSQRNAFVSGFCAACVELGRWHSDLAADLLRGACVSADDARSSGMDEDDVLAVEKILSQN